MTVEEMQALDRRPEAMTTALYVDQVELYLHSLAVDIRSENEVNQTWIESRPGDMYPDVESAARRNVLGLMAAAVELRHSVRRGHDTETIDGLQTGGEKPSVTMLDMLHNAVSGDSEALAAATENVSTMVREVTKKYQSVSKVTGHIDENGHFWQYGMNSRNYLMNTFAFVEVNKTTKDEAHGVFRFEEQVRRGMLRPGETYWEISLVPDGERQQLCDAGYFLESMSYVIRGLTLQKDGKHVDVEVAFVAGVDQDHVAADVGDEMSEEKVAARQEHALVLRHDLALLDQLEQSGRLHFNFNRDKSIQSFITPVEAAPNGVVDIVKLCDDVGGELLGKELFFGVVQPREDYASFPATCEAYMERFDGLVRDVLHDAMACVARGDVADPADIPPLLRKIVADRLVPRAVEVRDFDVRVLGASAAQLLSEAQRMADRGDTNAVKRLVTEAKKVASVDDCPSALKRSEKKDDDANDDEKQEGEGSQEACTISTFCPHCSDLNYDGSPSSFKVRVQAHIDHTKTMHCGRCYAYAGPTGQGEGVIKPRAAEWARKRQIKKNMSALLSTS